MLLFIYHVFNVSLTPSSGELIFLAATFTHNLFVHLFLVHMIEECFPYTLIVVRQLAEVTTGADNLSKYYLLIKMSLNISRGEL